MAATGESSVECPALPLISVIIPFHNGAEYLRECLDSVTAQTYAGPIEICLVNDASTDNAMEVLEEFQRTELRQHERISLRVYQHKVDDAESEKARGPGWGRNVAIRELASSDWLCLLDADDVCFPERIARQYQAVLGLEEGERQNTIVGSQFVRIPEGSTPVYSAWANKLTGEQLYLHRFRCVTLIQPTWLMHRSIFDGIGGYEEIYPAHPEDMIFFQEHLKRGGKLHKVEEPLVKYRYTPGSASSKITRVDLLKHRAKFLQDTVLKEWPHFSIWGAGRDGRRVFMHLDNTTQKKIVAMADINPAIIGSSYTNCWTLQEVPIVHFSQITSPFITCVSIDRFPEFSANLTQMGFQEGVDYYLVM